MVKKRKERNGDEWLTGTHAQSILTFQLQDKTKAFEVSIDEGKGA